MGDWEGEGGGGGGEHAEGMNGGEGGGVHPAGGREGAQVPGSAGARGAGARPFLAHGSCLTHLCSVASPRHPPLTTITETSTRLYAHTHTRTQRWPIVFLLHSLPAAGHQAGG